MSIFFILSIAVITLPAFLGSLSASISPRTVGVICHERPYLSLSQLHALSSPPSVSFFQSMSTSACVLQSTANDTASVNLNLGATVQRHEFLPIDLKLHRHDSTRLPSMNLKSLL